MGIFGLGESGLDFHTLVNERGVVYCLLDASFLFVYFAGDGFQGRLQLSQVGSHVVQWSERRGCGVEVLAGIKGIGRGWVQVLVVVLMEM